MAEVDLHTGSVEHGTLRPFIGSRLFTLFTIKPIILPWSPYVQYLCCDDGVFIYAEFKAHSIKQDGCNGVEYHLFRGFSPTPFTLIQ